MEANHGSVEGAVTAEEADLLHRSKRKVKQIEAGFSGDHSIPVVYGDEFLNYYAVTSENYARS